MSRLTLARTFRPLAIGLRTLVSQTDENGAGLAPRLRDAIAEQQDRSERLIGWFQLAIITIFAVLFAVAPKQLPLPLWERVAAWVIGAYLLFTIIRLLLSYRRRLPGWLLALSVVADVALLIVLIWSFHVEYRQPPSFSLKAPTLLYVFIFIALRALRFDARYVLLVGLAASVGWGLMILYAVSYDMDQQGGTAITRNYVTYLTSNSILLGAEFDKIISILIVTIVLAAAIVRARSLLVKSVAEEAAAVALSRFFSTEVAERIRGSAHEIRPGSGQLRDAAILTVDIRAFTGLAERLTPNEVISLLIEYETRLMRSWFVGSMLVLGALLTVQSPALAEKPEIFAPGGIAIRGYDVVAYFAEGGPVRGKPDYSLQWKGATWHFASAASRETFKTNPERYAPQYGGYCAYGVAQGVAPEADPMLWRIVDGKLYLNINPNVQERWVRDIPGLVRAADQNWPSVLKKQ